jgi:hypothetical protein
MVEETFFYKWGEAKIIEGLNFLSYKKQIVMHFKSKFDSKGLAK